MNISLLARTHCCDGFYTRSACCDLAQALSLSYTLTCTRKPRLIVRVCRPCEFFSVTLTSQEVSVILGEEQVSLLPSALLQVSPNTWRAMQVHTETHGTRAHTPHRLQHRCVGSVSVVSKLSGMLANAGVSILYLSTFSHDYILVGCTHTCTHTCTPHAAQVPAELLSTALSLLAGTCVVDTHEAEPAPTPAHTQVCLLTAYNS